MFSVGVDNFHSNFNIINADAKRLGVSLWQLGEEIFLVVQERITKIIFVIIDFITEKVLKILYIIPAPYAITTR
jgi:hypothetical protein